MIPKPKNLLYNFDDMVKGDYIKARDYKHAISIRNTGDTRGFKCCIRTVDNEIRVYLVGRRK
jgi:hypothetical protein